MIDELATAAHCSGRSAARPASTAPRSSRAGRPSGAWPSSAATSRASTSTRSSSTPHGEPLWPSTRWSSSADVGRPAACDVTTARRPPSDEQFRALFEPRGVVIVGCVAPTPASSGSCRSTTCSPTATPARSSRTNLQGEEVLGMRTVTDVADAARWCGRPRVRVHAGRGQRRAAARRAPPRASGPRS